MKVLQVKFIFCRCLQDEGFELFHKISCNEDVQGHKCIDKVGSKLTVLIFIYSVFVSSKRYSETRRGFYCAF